MKRIAAALPVALLAAAPMAALAYDLTTVNLLTQSEFKLLSEDLGAALSYKPIIPSEALGLTGFDLGVAASGTQLKNAVLLSKAANASTVRTTMPLLSARVHKGLPANIDIGVSYTTVPGTDIHAYGGELRWAVLPGSTLTPAVAIRASGTKLTGVDQLGFSTYGLDVSVSKGFAIFTPYGGVGTVWVKNAPQGTAAAAPANLKEEKFNQTKVYAGVNINLGVNLAFEYDNTGSISTVSAKVGFRF
jgi:hypothetical protein